MSPQLSNSGILKLDNCGTVRSLLVNRLIKINRQKKPLMIPARLPKKRYFTNSDLPASPDEKSCLNFAQKKIRSVK